MMSKTCMKTVMDAATRLHDIGLNPFPLRYGVKETLGKWTVLQRSRLHRNSLERIFGRIPVNLGVVCGTVSRNLFVIDCDSEESFRWMKDELAKRSMQTWVRSSHRGGHFYFLCMDGAVATENRKARGFQILGENAYVMVAPSLHPDTGELLTCDMPERMPLEVSIGDLAFLNLKLARIRPRRIEKSRIPDVADKVLFQGVTSKYDGDNSRAEFAACKSLIGASYTEEQILSLFRQCQPPHYRDVGETNFRRYILVPAFQECGDLPDVAARRPDRVVDTYLAALQATPFTGRHGATDKRVLAALAERMRMERRPEFRASVREVAQLSGLATATVTKSLMRLRDREYVYRKSRASHIDANLYRLNMEKVQPPEKSSGGARRGDSQGVTVASVDASHDVWHRDAFGTSGLEVFTYLEQHPGSTTAQISRGTGRGHNTVKTALSKMQQHALVTEDEGRVWSVTRDDIGDADWGRIAYELGTWGRTDRKAESFTEERQHQASRLIMAQVNQEAKRLQKEAQAQERQRACGAAAPL